jgi:Tfp pilus assembly protein PilF
MNRLGWSLLLSLVVLMLASRATAAQEGSGLDARLILEQFDFDPDASFLQVPVTIHGRAYPFVLDTGAAATLLDTGLKLGAPVGTTRVNGVPLCLYQAPRLRLGKIDFQSAAPLAGRSMLDFQILAWRHLHGLLGLDFLADKVLHLDFDHHKISFLKAVPANAGKGVMLFARPEDPRANIVADIAGWGPEVFCVDTGDAGSAVSLRQDLFQALAQLHGRHSRVTGIGFTIQGPALCRGGWPADIRAGNCLVRGVPIEVSAFPSSVLGLGFLRHFNLTFDFPHFTLYLQANERYRREHGWDLCGMRLRRDGARVVVSRVQRDSPAARAGLQKGDAVLKVGGKNAGRRALPELQALLSTPDQAVPIAYQRSLEERTAVLHLSGRGSPRAATDLAGTGLGKRKIALLLAERGLAHACRSEAQSALDDLDAAVQLDPKSGAPRCKRARFLCAQKKLDAALSDLDRALVVDGKNIEALCFRGRLHVERQKLDEGIADYSRAIALGQPDPQLLAWRAGAYLSRKQMDQALADLDRAVKLDPEYFLYHAMRAYVYAEKRCYREALAGYRKALALNGADGGSLNRLAWLLATCPQASWRDGRQAVEFARKACALSGYKNQLDLDTLAAACAEAGDFAQAVRWQKQALAMPAAPAPYLAEMRARLRLYEQERPYHAP